jgi:hypothetical protein
VVAELRRGGAAEVPDRVSLRRPAGPGDDMSVSSCFQETGMPPYPDRQVLFTVLVATVVGVESGSLAGYSTT